MARVWRISRILARGTPSSGSLLLPPPFAFYNGYEFYACLDFQDSALQIKMYYQFERVFEIDESHCSISIFPRDQDAFGIRWRCQKRFCAVPQSVAPHRAKYMKGDRSITFMQSGKAYLQYVFLSSAHRFS